MGKAATWVAILFLLGLNLLQLKITYDVVAGVESAQSDARKGANAAVAASDAQFRAQELGRALRELEKAVAELKALVNALPAEVKKETLEEAKALIPPPAPPVDTDLIRSSVMMLVNDELEEQTAAIARVRADTQAEVARLEKRLLTEMKDKKAQTFHVKQPLPQGEPTEPASPELPELPSYEEPEPAAAGSSAPPTP